MRKLQLRKIRLLAQTHIVSHQLSQHENLLSPHLVILTLERDRLVYALFLELTVLASKI